MSSRYVLIGFLSAINSMNLERNETYSFLLQYCLSHTISMASSSMSNAFRNAEFALPGKLQHRYEQIQLLLLQMKELNAELIKMREHVDPNSFQYEELDYHQESMDALIDHVDFHNTQLLNLQDSVIIQSQAMGALLETKEELESKLRKSISREVELRQKVRNLLEVQIQMKEELRNQARSMELLFHQSLNKAIEDLENI